jgi:threonine efflux protein
MRYATDLVLLGLVWFVVVLAPGPNFLAAVTASTGRGRRHGMQVAAGFAIGDAIWATSSMLGLAVLLARYGWLTEVVRFGGALMLVVFGLRALVRARRPDGADRAADPTVAQGLPAGTERSRWRRSGVLTGLLVDLGNPKAAVFFTSLFAALLPAGAPWWFKAATVVIVAAIPALWYSLVAFLFSTGRVASAYRRLRRPFDALAGTLFLGLGVRLAASG